MRYGAVLGAMLAVSLGCASGDARFPGVLEVDVEASRAGEARLYLDRGGRFSADAVSVSPLADTRAVQTLRFAVPAPVRRVRFDPFEAPGRVRLLAMRFVPRTGATLPLELRVVDIHDVARLDRDGLTLTLTTTPDGRDPSVILSTGPLSSASILAALEPIGARGVVIVAALLALVVVLPGATVLRAALRPADGVASATARVISTLLGAACLIIGARLWVVASYGSGVPIYDQWKVEAMDVYLPFGWGELYLRDLFAAHNEHRVLPSRVLALSLFLMDGRWNPLVQQTVNALLHAAVGLLLMVLLWERAGRRHLVLIAATVTLAFALPVATDNTLNGFQSCVALVLLALVGPLALLPDARAGSPAWWSALAALALGLVTFGSGMINVVCVLVYLVLAHGRRGAWGRLGVDAPACLAILALGLAFWVPAPPEHLGYAAGDVLHFTLLALGALAFPFVEYPWFAALVWLPVVLLIAHLARTRSLPDRFEATLLALSAWVFLQAVAIGYSRGNLTSVPSSRYLDAFSFVFVVNVLAATRLERGDWEPAERRARRLAVGVWAVAMVVGLARHANTDVARVAAVSSANGAAHERNLRRYLAIGDREWFAGLTFPWNVPVEVPRLLSEVLLKEPFLRARLPPAVAEPLRLAPSRRGPGPFRRDGLGPDIPVDVAAESWGSFPDAGLGEFTSLPIACAARGFLRVDVAGDIGDGDMRLRLVTERGRVHRLVPGIASRQGWEPVFVRCPEGTFRIVATDRDAERWFAIRAPVEYGWLSFLAAAALSRVWLLFAVGGLLSAWGVAGGASHRSRC